MARGDPRPELARHAGRAGAPRPTASCASRAPADRWRGLTGGEDIREFVDRIRLGAEKFLQERGVHRIDAELPVWHDRRPGPAHRA